MRQIVIYQSSTGFTKQYAKWIAERLQCEAKDIKQIKKNEISEYDRIVYGGWIMAGMVSGLDKIKVAKPKSLVVYGVGMKSEDDELIQKIIEQNQLINTPFFYYQGGVKMNELGFIKRQMLKMVKVSIENKQDKTAEDIKMLKLFNESGDYSNIEAIKSLVEYCTKNKH